MLCVLFVQPSGDGCSDDLRHCNHHHHRAVLKIKDCILAVGFFCMLYTYDIRYGDNIRYYNKVNYYDKQVDNF